MEVFSLYALNTQFGDKVNEAMYRTFYVDATNGNDDNRGTQSFPFKTIKKACDSVPIGGIGIIHLLTNYTPTTTESIDPSGKYLDIRGQGKDATFLTIPPAGTTPDTLKLYFKGTTSPFNILFQSLTIELESTINDINTFCRGLINISQYKTTFVGIVTNNMKLILNSDFHFISNHDNYYGGQFVSLKINYITDIEINDVSGTARIIDFGTYGGGCVFVHTGSATIMSGTTPLNWADYVSGIVKDANGVPRNVLSNIIL